MGVEKSVDELLRDEVARVEAMLDPVQATLTAIKTMAAPAVSAADKIDMLHRLQAIALVDGAASLDAPAAPAGQAREERNMRALKDEVKSWLKPDVEVAAMNLDCMLVFNGCSSPRRCSWENKCVQKALRATPAVPA